MRGIYFQNSHAVFVLWYKFSNSVKRLGRFEWNGPLDSKSARNRYVIKIGEMNRLEIARIEPWGFILNGGEAGEILLPGKHTKYSYSMGERVDVFIYLDSEDQMTATTTKPLAQVNRFAYLKVADVNPVGAFLDWGLPKDVLVPFDEQKKPMRPGESHIVYLYLDRRSRRITASSKVDRFLKSLNDDFETGMSVDLMVHSRTDLGYKCIINQTHWGILFYEDVFERLAEGQTLKGYIKSIRDDRKIDLCITPPGYDGIEAVSAAIMTELRENDGFVPLNDKSPPADISARFGVSKQMFKKAVGALYKQRRITLEKDGIRLT